MLVVNCPACAAEGRIPKDRINTALSCKKCLRTFHIRPSGQAVIGEPLHTGVTSIHPEVHHQAVDHTADVDQVFDKINKTFHRLTRLGLALAVVLACYGVYHWFQPASLEEQAVATSSAFARNDLTSLRELALPETSDQAVEWLDVAHPEFRDLVRQNPLAVPITEILSIKHDPEQKSAEILARITLTEPVDQRRGIVTDASRAPLSGQYIEVPFVLADRGWDGWRLDGKRTIAAFRKETETVSTTPVP